ncbi:MAG TPA: hypothetical protein VKE74_25845 [Gemmataceae bacterium]|nr:hypothetical protein [Gemmataceae bacterium]
MASGDRTKEDKSGQGRSTARELVALALAAGKTQQEAAARGQVNQRTVRRWLSEPAFRARVSELRSEMIAEASGRLTGAMSEAADELRALLANKKPDVRLRAAVKVIELATKTAEIVDLEIRIAAQEQLSRSQEARLRSLGGGWRS